MKKVDLMSHKDNTDSLHYCNTIYVRISCSRISNTLPASAYLNEDDCAFEYRFIMFLYVSCLMCAFLAASATTVRVPIRPLYHIHLC